MWKLSFFLPIQLKRKGNKLKKILKEKFKKKNTKEKYRLKEKNDKNNLVVEKHKKKIY